MRPVIYRYHKCSITGGAAPPGSFGFKPPGSLRDLRSTVENIWSNPLEAQLPYYMSMYYCTCDNTIANKGLFPACQDAPTCLDFVVIFPNISRGNFPRLLYLEGLRCPPIIL